MSILVDVASCKSGLEAFDALEKGLRLAKFKAENDREDTERQADKYQAHIKKLISKGARLWEKGGNKRLYFSDEMIRDLIEDIPEFSTEGMGFVKSLSAPNPDNIFIDLNKQKDSLTFPADVSEESRKIIINRIGRFLKN